MTKHRFSNEFTRVVYAWLVKGGSMPEGGYEEAKQIYEKHKAISSGVPFHRELERAFLAGLAERMPLLQRTHPLATEIALLAFDEVDWTELSEALIRRIERS
jgi:hypothetical protein